MVTVHLLGIYLFGFSLQQSFHPAVNSTILIFMIFSKMFMISSDILYILLFYYPALWDDTHSNQC